MTRDQWERAREVTADALELEPDARAAFIAAACVDDVLVHREVQRLVAEAASTGHDFLSSPPLRLTSVLARQAALSPTFSPGQIVASRFRVERFVNRGGMGEVFAGTDLELQEVVALKTIRPAISSSTDVIERFKREVSQSRRITHPNVCRVHDMFSHESSSGEAVWFLTMELLDGQTLSDRIAGSGPLPIDRALPLIRNVIDAIAAAHDLGIVHRDLKPNNVMLVKGGDEPERAVVTDFGLAVNISATEAGDQAAAGTPAYMAPEQANGETISLATDQYALGLMICKMLTGTLPELSATSAIDSRRQLRAWLRMQPRGAINFHLRRVISRCLRFHPADRFGDVREILPVMDGSRLRSIVRRSGIAAGIAALFAGVITAAAPYWDERVTDAIPLTAETGMAASPSISADGRWVAYQSDGGETGNLDVWIQPASGGQARRLTTHPAIDADPALSPDGAKVAFRSERDGGGIYVVNGDGSGERLLVQGGRSPVFSSDGRWIAYWTGTRDEAAPSGELYRIDPAGGTPIRLAQEFADARYPAWSSDGRFILFEGCERAPSTLNACNDWWVIQEDGSHATKTGAVATAKAHKLGLQTPPVKSWWRDEVLFSASSGSAMALWALKLSPTSHQAVGSPRRITQGDARERDPAALTDGTIVFGRATGALHIWGLGLPGTGASGSRRVTNDVGLDGCPSVSRDGRWLYLIRKADGVIHLIATDLSSGRESRLLVSDEDKYWPVASPSGDKVAVETRGKFGEGIWAVERKGGQRRLCTGCSHPTSWFAGEKAVLYATANGEIAQLDAVTGGARTVLPSESGTVLGGADWNATNEYMLFTATRHGSGKRTFAIRYRHSADKPEGGWIPLSADAAEMEQPHWSVDGQTVYFLSKRDGNNCVWGLRFDASGRRTIGQPFAVMHYHDSRLTPDTASPLTRGLSVSASAVFLNAGEVTDTVWRGRLAGPPWLGGFNPRKSLPFLR